MRLPSVITTIVSKIWQWWIVHKRMVGKVFGVIVAVISVLLTIHATRPRQELRFHILRRSKDVFSAEESTRLLILSKAVGVAVEGNVNTPDENSDGESVIALRGHSWDIWDKSLDAFEMEIINSGTTHLWYNSTDFRPKDAKPICIEMKPAVKILAARVVKGEERKNGFKLIENDAWERGCIECRWNCLASGESIVVRVAHARPETQTEIFLTGQLKECLEPLPWGLLQEAHRFTQQTFQSAFFWSLFLIVSLVMWGISCIRIIRKLRQDKKVPKILAISYDVAPPAITYWKDQILLRLWILLCLVLLIIYLVTL